jgi:hypothetical protein
MVLGSFLQMAYSTSHEFPVGTLGAGIGAACSGFALASGAVAFFRRMDRTPPPAPPTPPTPQTTVTVNQ